MSPTAGRRPLHRLAGRRAGAGLPAVRRLHVPRRSPATRHSRVERVIYRLIGVDPDGEQSWGVYARSVLAFSAVSILFLYVFQRVQDHLWLSLGFPAVPPALAWNTAVSFVTNTNWQSYSGESTMGHLVQMAGLAVQNFVSAAVGIAVAVALVRGFARKQTDQLGNFWVDLVRIVRADPAADRRGRRDRVRRRRHGPEPLRRHRRAHPGRRRPSTSPAGRSPARRSSRSSAPTAAASTTPTARTRSRTRPPGPTGWRSSCCW